MIDVEMQWCKEFVESLNGRPPTAAEVHDFLNKHILSIEEIADINYVRGFDDGKESSSQNAYLRGLEDGRETGYDLGYDAGYAIGYSDGEMDATP